MSESLVEKKITFYVDDQPVEADPGAKILWAALDAGFFIPHLCALRERDPAFGACRMCFVEVESRPLPVTACSETIEEGMRVYTQSDRVERLRRTALEMLLSHHDLNCKKCPANGRCGLQGLAKKLKVPLVPKRIRKIPRDMSVDESHPHIILNPNRCVLCGKCVWVCQEKEKSGTLDFVFRGLKTRVGPFLLEPLAGSSCTSCLKCVEVCPVGALSEKEPSAVSASAETGE